MKVHGLLSYIIRYLCNIDIRFSSVDLVQTEEGGFLDCLNHSECHHPEVKKMARSYLYIILVTFAESCAENKHLSGGVFFVESLPKTETGKVRRRTLVEGYKKHLKEVQSL